MFEYEDFRDEYYAPVCMRCENELTWCDCDKHND